MAKSTLGKGTEYTVKLGSFQGVDRDGGNISERRLSEAKNMYIDYDGDGGGVIESIPGFRKLYSFGSRIKRIYRHSTESNPEIIAVHTEDGLYSFNKGDMDKLNNLSKLGTVGSSASAGFSYDNDFYLLDGDAIYKLDRYSTLRKIQAGDTAIYIPTTYINGEEYEQPNLLSSSFKEEYKIEDPYRYSTASEGIIYTVTEPQKRFSTVTGIQNGYTGALFIPKYAKIDGIEYEVRAIGDKALENQKGITSLYIASGVQSIGKNAFSGCSSLTLAVIPDSVSEIGELAFSACTSLSSVYLGGGIYSIAPNVFSQSTNLYTVQYAGTESDFYKIPDLTAFVNLGVIARSRYGRIHVTLPVSTDTASINGVTVDGVSSAYESVLKDGKVSSVKITLTESVALDATDIVINGTLNGKSSYSRGRQSFLATVQGQKEGGFKAISRCRVAVLFDGRIFYSGNPKFPNAVFYTERDSTGENNPLYVGAFNYFNDGLGAYPVTSLLAVRDALAVFKGGDDGGGSIFYHTPLETGDNLVPKAYPVSYVHSGVSAFGPALSFLDDPVFLSPLGLSALAEKNISYERNLVCRSHNVNFDLLRENLSEASMTVWQGYLVICTRGRMYLADSRSVFRHETGNLEYEWFTLDGIGAYQYDARVFRYSTIPEEGFELHPSPDERALGVVNSETVNWREIFYSYEDGHRYLLYPTDEWEGGIFSPAVTATASSGLLFFGTERGEICVFNSDKRGVPPKSVEQSDDFDPEEYSKRMGRRIHEDFYAFDRHAPSYLIKTKSDDCGIPHLAKNTVRGSLVIKCKGYPGNKMKLEVETDRGGYREVASFTGSGVDFSSFNFSAVSFGPGEYASVPFGEREKNWVEKRITVSSSEYASPIGILSISYRFTVKGNIKAR